MRCHPIILTPLALGSLAVTALPSTAAVFDQKPIANQQAVVILRPLGVSRYDVLVIEEKQVGSQRCWRDRGDGTIEPLILNFDFTGVCDRATDSNGYSLRMGNEDLGLRYRLEVRSQANQALLLAVPFDSRSPTIPLGTTRSLARDFLKVDLNPNWRLTRRTYQGQTLGHYYFSTEQTLAAYIASNPSTVAIAPSPQRSSTPSLQPVTPTPQFSGDNQQPIPIPVVRLDQPNGLPLSPSLSPAPNALPITPAPASAIPLRPFTPSPSSQPLATPITPAPASASPLRPLIPPPNNQPVASQPAPTLQPLTPRPSLRPLTPAPAPTTSTSTPDRFTISSNGQLSSEAFLVVVPVVSGSARDLIQRIQQLGVPASNIFERGSRAVALGPFRNRTLAEQWQSHLSQQGGLNAQVEFGR